MYRCTFVGGALNLVYEPSMMLLGSWVSMSQWHDKSFWGTNLLSPWGYNCHHFLNRWTQSLGTCTSPPPLWVCTGIREIDMYFGSTTCMVIVFISTNHIGHVNIRGEHIHWTGDLVHVRSIAPLLYGMLRIIHSIIGVKVHHTHLDRKPYTQDVKTQESD